jgi:formate dehydrogenase beta subunit
VEISKWQTIVVNEGFMSTRAGVFSGGDCVTGADVLIRACAHGRLAAMHMDSYLATGKVEAFEEQIDEKFLDVLKVFDAKEKMQIPGGTKMSKIRHAPPAERIKNFEEYTSGYSKEEAINEAMRCLRCYRVVTYAYAKNKE